MLILFLVALIWCCDDVMFEEFKTTYGKTYDGEEHNKRFKIFCEGVELAKLMDEMYPDAEFGITKFSDITPKEFQNLYLSKSFTAKEFKAKHKFEKADLVDVKDTPSSWDWRDHGLVTSVKNQLQCGSCWAFSAVANIEGQWAKSTGELVSLSEQQVVDCDTKDMGCNGGIMDYAFEYVIGAGGIESYADYPYIGVQGDCKFSTAKVNATISSYLDLSTDETQMAAWSYANGPMSVAMNANDLQYYKKGVFDPIWCSAKDLDHGVTIVGWGVDKGLLSTKDYWIVKNSWGADWGLDGYFWILRGKGKCGINALPCSSQV